VSARAKIITTIAVVWLAAVIGIVAYSSANAETVESTDSAAVEECIEDIDRDADESRTQQILDCQTTEEVDTGSMWVAIGIATGLALVAVGVAATWTVSSPKRTAS
jgi:flagellar basal body-associated protein FliL